MKKIKRERDRIINQDINGIFKYSEELSILRKAIYDIANSNSASQEFYDYFTLVEALKESLAE
tara:strand:+ start:661 stop:849 length:189 start_codon:yes stop_codon:yes gene_type:complete